MVGAPRNQKEKQNNLKDKSKYWVRTHNFGLRITKDLEEALQVDKDNVNHLW